ncbi:MAG TPA: APC family permease [Candidatus Sulfotelmatobacter sp.]
MQIIEKIATPPQKKSVIDFLFGRPLSSDENVKEQIQSSAGVPVFGLDALSSAAYGPEAALTILIPLGLAGVAYTIPISLMIIVLLSIVYFSYRQTIAAYPIGGGSYSVASANLGQRVGLVAGAALMIDYILNVAVGISAGVGAMVSAIPALQPQTLRLCLAILLMLTLVNLRGIREAGLAFMLPTYVFVGSLGAVIVVGLFKTWSGGGHPVPVAPIQRPGPAVAAVSAWLLVRAFSSGCTAMTGVEAVSNGVQAFRDPKVKNAHATLTVIIATLIFLLAGIAYLCRAYDIAATPPGQPGYQSVLSQLTLAVTGRGVFYFITMAAVLTVLALSANTSFADFPRLCRAIAKDRWLPDPFTIRGRRLVFSFGVYVLAFLAASLLIAFEGVTDRLIPLFAVGAFMAFTLSQAGMVMHWRRTGGRGAFSSMLINGVGALATGCTTCVVIVAKFTEGAWLTVLAIPGLVWLMSAVHHHYERIEREAESQGPAHLKDIPRPIVILPLQRWDKISEKALRFAYTLSRDLVVVHITPKGQDGTPFTDDLIRVWEDFVEKPAREAGFKPPELVILHSPYRLVTTLMFRYVLEMERKHPDHPIAVLVPELVEGRWYYYFLHNQRATALRVLLYAKGTGRIIVISVPSYMRS